MKNTFASLVFALLVNSSFAASEQVLLAAEDDWYPYSAKIGQQAEGRSVDIVKAAYEAVGADLKLVVVPFNRGMILTKNGTYAGVFNASANEDLKPDYLIPRNMIALSEQVVVARIGEPFLGTHSFHGKRLSLTLGYIYTSDVTDDPKNNIERAAADINNLKKISVGHADFTIIDRLVFLSLLMKTPELKQKLAIVGKLQPNKIYILFSKTESGKRGLALFDQGMDKISRSGDLKKIVEKWEAKLR
jgi:polar amino acid transport system substrate-binding protein